MNVKPGDGDSSEKMGRSRVEVHVIRRARAACAGDVYPRTEMDMELMIFRNK
jgi:hypothetical protein